MLSSENMTFEINIADDDWDWLEEFPLFDEIQSLNTAGDNEPRKEDNAFLKSNAVTDSNLIESPQLSPDGSDLFASSQENSTTFIISNDNILYVKPLEYFHASLQPEQIKSVEFYESHETPEYEDSNSPISEFESEPDKTSSNESDINNEMEVVDEIIRNTALELDQWDCDMSSSDSSSSTTSEPSPTIKEEDYSDPEWRPEPSKSKKSKKSGGRKSQMYCRGGTMEDKKRRKKEQNKNAATRYRQKKKAEVSEILREEEELKEKKAKLEDKVTDIQNEIKCLKGLMRDLFKAKGLIN